MKIELRAHHDLPSGPEIVDAFLDAPGTWLPTSADERPFGGWSVELEGAGTSRRTALSVGPAWLDAHGTWRPIRWEPLGEEGELLPLETMLPVFVGELGVTGDAPGAHRLELTGSYSPPGGLVGGLLDHAGLHRVAQSSVERLLADIAARLEERARSRTHDPSEGPVSIGTTGPS